MTKISSMAMQNSGTLIVNGDDMAYSDFTPNSYTQTIWDNLLSYIGNPMGVAGMMGNLYHESHCYPNILNGDTAPPTSLSIDYTTRVDNHEMSRADFIARKAYGLAQWLGSRKENLYDAPWGGSQPSSGDSIGSLTRGLNMIYWELNGSYSSTLSACQNATTIDYATERVFTLYEGAGDSSLGQRQHYAQQIYNLYSGTGEYYILTSSEGNGRAYTMPTIANAGDIISLTCTPASGETVDNIDARMISSQQSIALTVMAGTQTFPMPNDNVSIYVKFSGVTPPPPPPPPVYNTLKKGLPIWAYPSVRRLRT